MVHGVHNVTREFIQAAVKGESEGRVEESYSRTKVGTNSTDTGGFIETISEMSNGT